MSKSSFQDEVLNSTNYYRKQFQVEPVTWNDTLADFADDYVKGCIWKHSGGPYGENLASGYETTALAIDAWGDEEHLYNWAKQKFSEGAGHFTQLVWSNTTTVGCGVVNCTEEGKGNVQGRYLICEYWPRGNVQTQFGWNVKKPGTAKDGTPGFGGAGRSVEVKGVVAALAAVTILLAVVA
ncbi:unnamed protein product [Zymoseptoria tritici ST99CH_1A5]|uniref:SCP domain-containing protein n=3 Tax=Zymoseptoria tritici TaxID=1047171 RepID=A0A1X7RYX6_ZYMT9|nr:unnamed protein product [Zymoseptoria tritici ST99CH_3D7]SMR55229.1 unnamed protein product [Zymoseptoria tritici ST99CH_1E4]SMR57603.1 unnamed protein product [Zymoseptoria tritici ST99CH_3D1]SMY26040.1 unnamed protein product [Zymoseptoria tritici ST99CH_1A5]